MVTFPWLYLYHNYFVGAVIVDLSKAFDSAFHILLILKVAVYASKQLGKGKAGGGLSCPFLKIAKSALILEKKYWLCPSLG